VLEALNLSDARVYPLMRDDVAVWVYGSHSLGVMMARLVLRCVYRCEASYPGADGDSFSKVGLALPSTGVHEDVGIAHSGLSENVNLIRLSPGEASTSQRHVWCYQLLPHVVGVDVPLRYCVLETRISGAHEGTTGSIIDFGIPA
jgi:hypothetical protein